MKKFIAMIMMLACLFMVASPSFAGWSQQNGNSTYNYNSHGQLTSIETRNGSVTSTTTYNPQTGACNQN
jgi:YD repeat-containing protein